MIDLSRMREVIVDPVRQRGRFSGGCLLGSVDTATQTLSVARGQYRIHAELTPATGVPVVLMHGFPDSGRLWRHQAPALAEAGFQVIVPDLRGYGRSGKPEAVAMAALICANSPGCFMPE